MKKNLFIAFIALFCISNGLNAQVNLIKDNNGIVLGYEDATGNLYNNGSSPVMVFDESGNVTDPNSMLLYSYNTGSGNFSDSNDSLVFVMNESGQIINTAGSVIGSVDGSGNVFEGSGHQIAMAPGIPRFKLAYFFFFCNK